MNHKNHSSDGSEIFCYLCARYLKKEFDMKSLLIVKGDAVKSCADRTDGYSVAKTSDTDGTLCEIVPEIDWNMLYKNYWRIIICLLIFRHYMPK
jgi:hypothetical protein